MNDVFYQDNSVTIYCGDCREILKELPEKSVHCCVTSPPYWGLRDYGLESLVWDGESKKLAKRFHHSHCEHEWGDHLLADTRTENFKDWGNKGSGIEAPHIKKSQGQFCQLCNAWRGSLGLEPTPELYVQHLVEIFREVKRVLRDDGTIWVNMGDSYNSGTQFNHGCPNSKSAYGEWDGSWPGHRKMIQSLKPKDLIGIPWRVAFALQADGWYLRSDIIWAKPNPMPESVTDRPTKAHEYVFLLSKNQRYYYDADAIREPHKPESIERDKFGYKAAFIGRHTMPRENRPHSTDHEGFNNPAGRNKRSVWTIATQPFPEAHFAVFPEKLVEPCILAGCPRDGIILDLFAGAGTVGAVAKDNFRRAILIDIKEEYCEMAVKRFKQEVFDFG